MNKKQVVRLNENQLKKIVSESVKRMLNEVWVNEPQMPSEEIFNEIVKDFPQKWNVLACMRRDGSFSPYEFFGDYIKDVYPVTLEQCDEICTMLKNHYKFKKFYATD